MISRRIFFFSSAAILISSGSAFAATAKTKTRAKRPSKRKRAVREEPNLDPVATVTGVYQRAMKDKDGRVVTLSFAKGDRARIFSKELVAAWETSEAGRKSPEDVGPIDFDPVTNSQGLHVKSFKLVPEKLDEVSAAIAVTIEAEQEWSSPADKIIRYDFVREDAKWRIDDIRGSSAGKPWSIKELLTRPPKR